MKNNQKGFSVVEILIVIVVVGLLGAAGWLVYDRQNKTNNSEQSAGNTQNGKLKEQQANSEAQPAQTVDETQNWTNFTSSKGWQLRIPDGWELYTDTTSAGLTAYSSLEYKAGTRAVIEKTSFGRGGPFVLSTGNYAAGDPATEKPDYLTDETVFKAKNVEGRRYTGTLKEDVPMDGFKGDTIYWYVFVKDTKSVIFRHHQPKDAKSIVADLEKALSTLEFK